MQLSAQEIIKMQQHFPKGSSILITEGKLRGFAGFVRGIDINGRICAEVEGHNVVLDITQGDELCCITKERLPEKDCYCFERELQQEGLELSILNRNTGRKDTMRIDDDSLFLEVEKDVNKKIEGGIEESLANFDLLEKEVKEHIKAAVYTDLINNRYMYPEADKGEIDLNIEEFTNTVYREHFQAKVKEMRESLEKAHSRSETKNPVRPAQKTQGKVYKGVVRCCDRKGFVTEQGGLSIRHEFSDIAENAWKNIYNGKTVKIAYCKRAHMLDKAARAETWEQGKEIETGREFFKNKK